MIAQLTGTVASIGSMDVVINCGGVGYAVSIPLSTRDTIPEIGADVTLRTILVVREDAFTLYGFSTEGERDAFRLLTSIQGIGGRIALGILSAASIAELQRNILQNNLPSLMRLPGIGKKTAERMVVELRDKIVGLSPSSEVGGGLHASIAVEDAISALQALGYTKAAAEKAVKSVIATNPALSMSSEEVVRHALRMGT